MDEINKITGTAIGWVNTGINFGARILNGQYSKLVYYGALGLVLAKILKVKVDVSAGKGKK